MQLLPRPEVKPARPGSPEPDESLLLLAQILIARIILDTRVDHLGIRATQLSRLAMNSDPAVTESLAEWAIYKLLETTALRLVYDKPTGHTYWAGFPGEPPPKMVMWVSLAEQVVAPNPDLHTWIPDYIPPTSVQSAGSARQQRDLEPIEKALARQERESRRLGRPRDATRIERGKIILAANKSGVSWKNMPSHILKTYPDWFPEYRKRRPDTEERKRLQERLRRMARDVDKYEE